MFESTQNSQKVTVKQDSESRALKAAVQTAVVHSTADEQKLVKSFAPSKAHGSPGLDLPGAMKYLSGKMVGTPNDSRSEPV